MVLGKASCMNLVEGKLKLGASLTEAQISRCSEKKTLSLPQRNRRFLRKPQPGGCLLW
jgi:hypothetical protein